MARSWQPKLGSANASADVYGTRWVRASLVVLATLVPVGVIGAGVAQGALAMAFTATSSDGDFVTRGVTARDIGAIISPQQAKDPDGNVGVAWVLEAVAEDAYADGLCLTEKATLLGNTMTLRIVSHDPAMKIAGVRATVFEAATYSEIWGSISVNKNAADVTTSITSLEGLVGELGIETDGLKTKDTSGTIQAAVVKEARVRDFRAEIIAGDVDCPRPG